MVRHVLIQSKTFFINVDTNLFSADGVFGAYMDVSIKNDGPVTITIDSPSESKKPDEEITQS